LTPRGDDLVPGLEAFDHRHLVAAPRAELHELLPDALVLGALWGLMSSTTNTELPYGA
jgi:hypothetical protein